MYKSSICSILAAICELFAPHGLQMSYICLRRFCFHLLALGFGLFFIVHLFEKVHLDGALI